MKKTYIKIIISEIRKSFGRFVAIFAIVALGIGFLAGLLMATPDMHASVDAYYDKNNMADIFIKSTMGITETDIEAVSSMEEVEQVMPAYVTDALMKTDDDDVLATRVFGLPLQNLTGGADAFVNRLEIVEGRLPKSKNECLVEQAGGYLSEIALGTTLKLSEENKNYATIGEIYNTSTYTVVGIVSNPFYFSTEKERTGIGSGKLGAIIYVDESCYSLPVYTDLYVTVTGASDLTAFTKEYETHVKEAVDKLETLGKSQSLSRFNDSETANWYVLDRDSNVSYVSFSENSKKVAAIATVFPIFFLLVAALIALTTMTRMVEEERTQIGTLKALGYSKGAIMYKYIAYSGTASFLGSITGLIAGFALLPGLIWQAYAFSYHLPPFVAQFSWAFALIATALALSSTIGATVSACHHALKEKPASLMLPRAPKAGKRIFLERINFIWSKMKFTQKATARNLIRNKKHFLLTVVGIAGCTALILTGFGLRDSVGSIAKTQFSQVIQYDLIVVKEKDTGTVPLNAFLKDPAQVKSYLEVSNETGHAINKTENIEATVYVPKIPAEFMEYIHLRERISGKEIAFDDTAVVVTEKLAAALGIKKGDRFTLENKDGKTADLTVTGIAENYVGSYVYINPAEYSRAFGEVKGYDTLLVKTTVTDTAEQEKVLTSIMAEGGISNAEFTAQVRKSYDDLLSTINFVVIVLIIAAGALAAIVLYNLTNINISERKKELATLRVLGFHFKEVGSYIFRETAILTLIGTIAGLLLGLLLHHFVITIAESTDMMFGRDISAMSFLLSTVVTFFFSFLVNLIMYKKLKKIAMVDSMKAVD